MATGGVASIGLNVTATVASAAAADRHDLRSGVFVDAGFHTKVCEIVLEAATFKTREKSARPLGLNSPFADPGGAER